MSCRVLTPGQHPPQWATGISWQLIRDDDRAWAIIMMMEPTTANSILRRPLPYQGVHEHRLLFTADHQYVLHAHYSTVLKLTKCHMVAATFAHAASWRRTGAIIFDLQILTQSAPYHAGLGRMVIATLKSSSHPRWTTHSAAHSYRHCRHC